MIQINLNQNKAPQSLENIARGVDVRTCCVPSCHAIYRPHRDEWISVGEPIYREILKHYNVSHGYCPECYQEARQEIRKAKQSRRDI